MSSRTLLLISFLSCCLGSAHAAVTVGTCETTKHSYTTITAAINAVEDGGEIHVCAGTYTEQLTIQKPIRILGIGNVTVAFPSTGLVSQPPPSIELLFTQVFIKDAGGPVLISDIAIQGGNLFLYPYAAAPAYPYSGSTLCQGGALNNYWGLVSLNSFVVLDHVSVGGQNIFGVPPGTIPTPLSTFHCGSGIKFQGGKGVVTHSSVSVGAAGILGASTVDHTFVGGFGGSYSSGISGASIVRDNTVAGPGYAYGGTRGISGGDDIEGNVVQGWSIGIQGEVIKHNTLIQNSLSVTGANDISDILVVADATYPNPACSAFIGPPCGNEIGQKPLVLPTTAIDLACADGTRVRNNSIVGAGIAFANLDPNRTISPTNLLYNVTTTSTKCP